MGRPRPGIPRPVLLACGVFAASALGGCPDEVALATECPPLGKRCLQPDPPPEPGDASLVPPASSVDSGVQPMEDAGTEDAGPPVLPEMDGGPPVGGEDWIRNGSFELTDGTPAGPLDGDGLDPGPTRIDPWVACRDGATVATEVDTAASGSEPDLLTANDGDVFVNASYPTSLLVPSSVLGVELSQTLPAPLEVGRTYAFSIDLSASSAGVDVLVLQVYGSDTECDTRTLLGSSDVVPDRQGWRRACFQFQAQEPHSVITLAPRTVVPVGVGIRMFMDNLRPVPSCP